VLAGVNQAHRIRLFHGSQALRRARAAID